MSEAPYPREIWTRLAVDPLADPLSERLSRHPAVTPNRVTAVALLLGVSAAGCFAVGALRIGGLLFLLRYFADCVDGTVARLQHTTSERGASFDVGADILGIALAFGALSWHLVHVHELPNWCALALLGSLVVYNWALSHRKHLAERADLGSGGARHEWQPVVWGIRHWVQLCRRLNMCVVPWSVEVEIAALGLAPLFLTTNLVGWVLVLAFAFYVMADVVNLLRIRRIAGILDSRRPSILDSGRSR
jgi:phosphatidylglycerophosphate synthase